MRTRTSITVAIPKGTVPFSSNENWDSLPPIPSSILKDSSVKLAEQFVEGIVGRLLDRLLGPGRCDRGAAGRWRPLQPASWPPAFAAKGLSPPTRQRPSSCRRPAGWAFPDSAASARLEDIGLDEGLEVGQLRGVRRGSGRAGPLVSTIAAGSFARSPAKWYCARKVSGPIQNSPSGGSGASWILWPPINVPLNDPKSRTINSPSRSNNSVCRRLIIGWAIVSRACRPRPITIGNWSLMVRLLAFPPTTISSASIEIPGPAPPPAGSMNSPMVILAGACGNKKIGTQAAESRWGRQCTQRWAAMPPLAALQQQAIMGPFDADRPGSRLSRLAAWRRIFAFPFPQMSCPSGPE